MNEVSRVVDKLIKLQLITVSMENNFQTSIAIGPLLLYISSVVMTIFVKFINKKLGEKVVNHIIIIILSQIQ